GRLHSNRNLSSIGGPTRDPSWKTERQRNRRALWRTGASGPSPNREVVVMMPEPALSDLRIPREYNAAVDLIDRNVAEGRGSKPAVLEPGSILTYADLAARMNRAGNALKALGVQIEQRILLCLCDSADFPAFFWGAIKIGAVPVPVNTLLSSKEYDFLLRDS